MVKKFFDRLFGRKLPVAQRVADLEYVVAVLVFTNITLSAAFWIHG